MDKAPLPLRASWAIASPFVRGYFTFVPALVANTCAFHSALNASCRRRVRIFGKPRASA